MADGIGCQCNAWYSGECCCEGVDWTDSHLIELEKQRDELLTTLELLLKYSEQFLSASEGFLSDTDFDSCGWLADTHAELSVIQFPKVKETISRIKKIKEQNQEEDIL